MQYFGFPPFRPYLLGFNSEYVSVALEGFTLIEEAINGVLHP